MSCINPLVAYPSGLTKYGKVKYIPAKREAGNVDWIRWQNDNLDDSFDKPILIPCGKCIGCRLDYSREWAARCMLEMKDHDSAYFLTLTYSDPEAPRVYFESDGDCLPALSLRKRDLQLFIKRVRKNYPNDKIRFFGCGEYGSNTLRPHYHVILFGLHLDDLKLYKRTDTGLLYNSDKLSGLWCRYSDVDGIRCKFPLGFVVVANVNWDTCAYVARYTAKKTMTVGDDFWNAFNMEKPFIQMSRRPGIGRSYLDKHPEVFDHGSIFLPAGDDVRKCSIPKYYFKALEQSDPDLAEDLRRRRRDRANTYQRALANSHKRSYDDLLEDTKITLLEKAKALQRDF